MTPHASSQADTDTAVISVRGLSFWYQTSTPPVVYNVNLDIHPNSCLAIVGASGAGKTTLLRLLSGLLTKEIERTPWAFPNSRIECDTFLKQNPDGTSPRFAYVPQLYHTSLLISDSVRRNIQMGSGERHLSADLQQIIQDMDLLRVLDSSVASLSGGQQQRVAICRALASQPDVLFLDEPFANLDFLLRNKLVTALRGISERCCVVLVSHDIKAAGMVADRMIAITLENGLSRYTEFSEPNAQLDQIESHLTGQES